MASFVSEKTDHMAVSVRVRPINERERENSEPVIYCLEKSVIIRCDGEKVFNFEKVFHEADSQKSVFEKAVTPMICQVLSGFNCTIFCYGSTGSGKTYTLIGGKLNEMESPEHGMILRAYNYIKNKLQNETNYSIMVSNIEIYNEEIYDLMGNERLTKLKIYNVDSNINIQGLTELLVASDIQFIDILQKSVKKRKTALTQLNSHSSRSHSIFTITVSVTEETMNGQIISRTGKLKFVDLAGSENISKSCVDGKGLRETSLINRSLLSLGMVINTLASRNKRNNYICFRESKLTRLLEDSLGGTTYTLMIANISPAKVSLEETKSTLIYAENAQHIICNPKKNLNVKNQSTLEMLKKERDILRKRLESNENKFGVYIPYDIYYKEQEEIRNLKKDYANLCIQNTKLSTDLILSQEKAEQCETRNLILLKEYHELKNFTQNDCRIYTNKIYTMRKLCANENIQIENFLNDFIMKYQRINSTFIETVHSSHQDVLAHLFQTISLVNSQVKDFIRESQDMNRSINDLVEYMKVNNEMEFNHYLGLSKTMENIEKLVKAANEDINRRKLYFEPTKHNQEEVEKENAKFMKREEHVLRATCSILENNEHSQAHSSADVKFLEQASKFESLTEKLVGLSNIISTVLDHIKQRQNIITFNKGMELTQETKTFLKEAKDIRENINNFFERLTTPSGDTPDFKRRAS